MLSKRLPQTILGLLVLLFILGTLANLYQTIPSGNQKYEVYHQLGFILFHVFSALALLILAIVFLVKAKRRHMPKRVIKMAVGGLVPIVIAYVSGILFIETNNDLLSLLMALGFIGAFICYAQLAYGPELSTKER